MSMILTSPSTVSLPEDSDKVREFLTYSDASVQYQIKELSRKYYWKKSDPDGYSARMDQLKSQQKKSLLFHDEAGTPYTYAGLWQDLRDEFGWSLSDKRFECPPPERPIPWDHVPENQIRYYQDEAVNLMLSSAGQGPVSIELPTGSGKSRIIEELCHRNPVRTAILTPSKNVTNQLYDEMLYLFGKKRVGKYGDGRHDVGKLFTVCTAQAVMRVKPDSEEEEFFKGVRQFVFDESHVTPANTFEAVELGLFRDVPNRFHVSATQMRPDGQEMKLRGIIGPIVYRKEFKDLVREGYLAEPYFKVFKVPYRGIPGNQDINQETRDQLYLNPNVNSLAAEFANKAVTIADMPTVILIDEFAQFNALRNFLGKVPFEFVHGGQSSGAEGSLIPEEYRKPDVRASVDRFNRGDLKLLVGTSAISTGVDLKPTACLVYLQGGISEIKVRQAVGRGTRITDKKKSLVVVDFKVAGSYSMERHAEERMSIYRTMGEVEEISK